MSILSKKHILLGVTGSIAGYKAADLASKLAQGGAQVDVILTGAGEKFITPLTFQSGNTIQASQDNWMQGLLALAARRLPSKRQFRQGPRICLAQIQHL